MGNSKITTNIYPVLSISHYIPGTSYVSSFLIIRKSCEVDNCCYDHFKSEKIEIQRE